MYLGIVAIPSSIYFLSFTYKGGVLYLQAQLKSKTEILHEEISFFVKGIYTLAAYINTVSCGHLIEHRIIHSTQHLTLHENAATPFLVNMAVWNTNGKRRFHFYQMSGGP